MVRHLGGSGTQRGVSCSLDLRDPVCGLQSRVESVRLVEVGQHVAMSLCPIELRSFWRHRPEQGLSFSAHSAGAPGFSRTDVVPALTGDDPDVTEDFAAPVWRDLPGRATSARPGLGFVNRRWRCKDEPG